ncbi:MAG: hypothetical protein K2X38_25415 [Gemmataceae bacterium]|nr:hypothetical protein [Gemmataceae bacterium]
MKQFATIRLNGKSNSQVLVELVSGREPGTVFTHGELAEALGDGVERVFDINAVRQAVYDANKRLLREHSRILRAVTGVGYAIAFAKDHQELAIHRNRKSNRQLKWALDTLQHVRLDELTEQQRLVHMAQQVVNTELIQHNRRVLKRQQQHATLIAGLTHRVEQVEAKVAVQK